SSITPDVWYAYVSTCTGTLRVDTCGSNYDTVLSVHSACPGTPGNELACNDDCRDGSFSCGTSPHLESCLTYSVSAGVTYLIHITGYNGATGNYTLHTAISGSAPPNDACGAATLVTIGQVAGSTCTATVDGSSSCGFSNSTPDVWYNFTASCTGTL